MSILRTPAVLRPNRTGATDMKNAELVALQYQFNKLMQSGASLSQTRAVLFRIRALVAAK